jgi:hypothetical protein
LPRLEELGSLHIGNTGNRRSQGQQSQLAQAGGIEVGVSSRGSTGTDCRGEIRPQRGLRFDR